MASPAVTLLTVIALTGEPSEWIMLRIVPQTPEDPDPDSVVEVGDQEVITNPTVAVADKTAVPMVKAVVAAMVNKAVMVAGTAAVAVAVDKEAHPMARAAAAAVMVNNSSIKVNKVVIPDSLEHSRFTRCARKVISRYPIRLNLFLCLAMASSCPQEFAKYGPKQRVMAMKGCCVF
jgi:hypothetical protein